MKTLGHPWTCARCGHVEAMRKEREKRGDAEGKSTWKREAGSGTLCLGIRMLHTLFKIVRFRGCEGGNTCAGFRSLTG